jgi:hypothetical protein
MIKDLSLLHLHSRGSHNPIQLENFFHTPFLPNRAAVGFLLTVPVLFHASTLEIPPGPLRP